MLGKRVACPNCSHEFLCAKSLECIEKLPPPRPRGCLGVLRGALLGLIFGGVLGLFAACGTCGAVGGKGGGWEKLAYYILLILGAAGGFILGAIYFALTSDR